MARDEAPRPFFIVGAARSGTTLLRVTLDRHPDVAIPPESHFIPILYKRWRRSGWRSGHPNQVDRFLQDLAGMRRFQDWGMTVEEVAKELRDASAPPTFAEMVAAAFRAYALRQGKRRWGDKTPRYVYVLPTLDRMFPEAQFIHLIRDGRDVALSRLAHRGTAASSAWYWAQAIRRGRAAGRAMGPHRYREVFYEHLVDNPESELRGLCAFLNLDFDPVMVREEENGLERLPPQKRVKHSRAVVAPTKGMRDWRRQMSPRDLARFEAVAGGALVSTGYVPAARVGVASLMAAWAEVALLTARASLSHATAGWEE